MKVGVGDCFLDSGNFDLLGSVEGLFEAFPVRQISGCAVVWINYRYFQSVGICVNSRDIRKQLMTNLLTTFGVESDPKGKDGELHADRYGATGGAYHGGSGRCGCAGGFNAKGVGRTPLASEKVDFYHSHGYLSLTEAIREAIFSEIAISEVSTGAVPVVAIIAVDDKFDFLGIEERKAILVRPNFLRPAHFERSIFFGSVGSEGSDQYIDSARVKSAVKQYEFDCKSIKRLLFGLAKQLGELRALRLWQSQFTTSNLTVSHQLVDFGAFRSVLGWCRYVGAEGEKFGDEVEHLEPVARSLFYYSGKYLGYKITNNEIRGLLLECKGVIDSSFCSAIFRACKITTVKENSIQWLRLSTLFKEYYEYSQKRSVYLHLQGEGGGAWIYNSMIDRYRRGGSSSGSSDSIEQQLIDELYEAMSFDRLQHKSLGCPVSALLWMKPRDEMFYDKSMNNARVVGEQINLQADENDFELCSYIESQIMANRRVFSEVPLDYFVHSGITRTGVQTLYCINRYDKSEAIFINAFQVSGRIYIEDLCVDIKLLSKDLLSFDVDSVQIKQVVEAYLPNQEMEVVLGPYQLHIPAMYDYCKELRSEGLVLW